MEPPCASEQKEGNGITVESVPLPTGDTRPTLAPSESQSRSIAHQRMEVSHAPVNIIGPRFASRVCEEGPLNQQEIDR